MVSKPGETAPISGDPSKPGAPTGDQPKLLTQEEVNAIVGKVRSEERAKYADYDDLKGKAKSFEESQRQKLTEAERLKHDLAAAQRTAADAEMRVANTMIETEIRIKAASHGFINPSTVLRLVGRDGITYSEEKGVSGVEEALIALKASDPYLVAPSGQAARAPNLNPAPRQSGQGRALTADQREAAQRMHLSEEEYAKGLRDTT